MNHQMPVIRSLNGQKQYDAYGKWLPKLPASWTVKKLKFLGYIYAGLNGKKGDDFSKEKRDDFEPFIPFTNICNNREISSDFQYVRVLSNEDQNKVKYGDLLFLMSSETHDDIGKCAIYLQRDPVYLNSFCKGFRITDNSVSPHFVNYLLASQTYRGYFSETGRGFTRINLKQEYVNDVPIALPPPPEQTRIVQFLDRKTAQIDKAIAQKERLIELLKERRQILIHNAVTKGLNPNVKMKDSGVEWIGEIPEHWEVRKVTHLFGKIGSGTTPNSGDARYYGGKINWLQTGDLTDGQVLHTSKTITEKALTTFSALKRYPVGSIVIAMYGATIGKVGILSIEAATNQACCVLSSPQGITNLFAYFWLLAAKQNIIAMGYGGGQPNISQDLVKSIRIPIPPLREQIEITQKLKTIDDCVKKSLLVEEELISRLREYRASLMNSVVLGTIKVAEGSILDT